MDRRRESRRSNHRDRRARWRNRVKVRNWILRTDFWGRTCGMRLGVCADKPWQDCEDGNHCTINWCDPDAGCTHPALPDGSRVARG
ncbi:MAG: hypothetical protein R3F39_09590 [Myxococcota bacterium]